MIRLYENGNGIDITVTEGVVRLDPIAPALINQVDHGTTSASPGTLLKAGHRARIGNKHEDIQSLDEQETQKSIAWRDGFLVFEDESLEYDEVSEISFLWTLYPKRLRFRCL